MTSAPEQSYLSTCPVCRNQIDVTSLEPFTKLKCPFCGQMVRVRRKFDHFMIVRQIGEGGMSRVFEAEDETLGRRVALKILNRQYGRDAARVEQFRQEALITANVNHPNVIKLYSVGYDQGYFYIAMELVNGGSLEQRIRREGTIPEAEALRIGREVAEGLRAAQQLGLIHRDVKPANILFTETGTAKVVDFGLALFVERGPDASGEIWATPYYVAPEKIIDNREDYRSDIFSLGASLFHALTGRPPHKANSNDIEHLRLVKCRPVYLEDSGMRFAPRTVHVINRMLAFRPQERCANYDETVEELRLAEGLIDQSYARRFATRRKLLLSAAILALVTAFVVGWLARSRGERAAVAITERVEASHKELSGDGVSLQAGRKTVAERFIEARETMLKQQRFAEAKHQFERLIASGEARQPTLNWARYNAALCSIVIDKRSDALVQVQRLAEDIGEGNALVSAELAAFFKQLGMRMGDHLGVGQARQDLGYATDNEAVLGYLLHGLAEWHFGDPMKGRELLEFFATRLGHLKPTESTTSLDWVTQYGAVVKLYEKDLEVAKSLQDLPTPTDLASCRKALQQLRQAQSKLSKPGRLRQVIERQVTTLKNELANLTVDQERQRLLADRTTRARESAQLAETLALLPTLITGYDYSRAIETLHDIRFASPEIQSALEGQRYLYEEAQAFLTQIFTDFQTQGYQGRIFRRSGSVLEGTINAANLEQIRVSLENGVLVLPLDSISPETLVNAAQHFADLTTDSTDYYQRKERIAAFARVCGLYSLSNATAAQLMEENRAFRPRWLKVVQ